MDVNSHQAWPGRRESGTLTWPGPALMLFARIGLAVGAQALFALVFFLAGSPRPWKATEPWLPVYGTLIDVGCLTLHLLKITSFYYLWVAPTVLLLYILGTRCPATAALPAASAPAHTPEEVPV